uniref:Uncharacterized protein n=2 Tax=Timema TaxID=61471 RepID=A0A7R9IU54_9NEOP|nr:unnamed protein product [Timema bartmani]CAD7464707.1 unnamed protein product [Timema tahoe]
MRHLRLKVVVEKNWAQRLVATCLEPINHL